MTSIRLDAEISFSQAASGAVERTVEDKLRETISLADFGYVGDCLLDSDSKTVVSGTDDTAAWKKAIAAARAGGASIICVPWGETGISLVEGEICDGLAEGTGQLPPGLRFIGQGGGSGGVQNNRPRLQYSGSETCWNISYSSYAELRETGNWAWENLIFGTSEYAATMFSFQDPTTHNPVDGAGYTYIREVEFRSVSGLGAGSGYGDAGEQLGAFLQAAKVFHLVVDDNCDFSAWRRAFWLKGCDNCVIQARFAQSNRHIMIEHSGSFGNNNFISSRFLGPITIAGATDEEFAEEPYLLWDNGVCTTVLATFFEETAGAEDHAVALAFLDGFGTRMIAAVLQGAPIFRLGPTARECFLDQPVSPVYNADWAAIIDAPETTDFGYAQQDYRLIVTGARENMQRMIGLHPRVRFMDHLPSYGAVPDLTRELFVSNAGIQPAAHICAALNYWGRSNSTAVSGGVAEFATDANASQGYAIRLDKDAPQPSGQAVRSTGFELRFVVGQDIQPGWFRLSHRTRHATAESDIKWGCSVFRQAGGVGSVSFVAAVHPEINHTSYQLKSGAIDGTGWAIDDVIFVRMYWSDAGVPTEFDDPPVDPPDFDFFVDYVEMRPIEAAVANLTLAATSGSLPTPNGAVTIANAASPTNAELLELCVELKAKLDAALATMRSQSAGIIAP